MGIFGSFKRANEVIEQSRRDVAKGKKNDEVAKQRAKKQGGKR